MSRPHAFCHFKITTRQNCPLEKATYSISKHINTFKVLKHFYDLHRYPQVHYNGTELTGCELMTLFRCLSIMLKITHRERDCV